MVTFDLFPRRRRLQEPHWDDSQCQPTKLCQRDYLRDRGKHALIDGKEEVGYSGAADRRLRQDIPEAEVGKITQELASSVRKGKRVPPEEPLEGSDSRGHHGEPYQREGGLSSCQTRVEEARAVSGLPDGPEDTCHSFSPNTRNHE